MLLLSERNLFILCTKSIKLMNNCDVMSVYVCQKVSCRKLWKYLKQTLCWTYISLLNFILSTPCEMFLPTGLCLSAQLYTSGFKWVAHRRLCSQNMASKQNNNENTGRERQRNEGGIVVEAKLLNFEISSAKPTLIHSRLLSLSTLGSSHKSDQNIAATNGGGHCTSVGTALLPLSINFLAYL